MAKEPTFRRTIELPAQLQSALQERADAKGVSLNALIRDILERSAAQSAQSKAGAL